MIIEQSLVNEVADALRKYREAVAGIASGEDLEDYLRLVAITEKLMTASQADDVAGFKLGLLGFSRQVSDSFVRQPAEFKALASKVDEMSVLVFKE